MGHGIIIEAYFSAKMSDICQVFILHFTDIYILSINYYLNKLYGCKTKLLISCIYFFFMHVNDMKS